jgi:hypothetical protein
MRKLWKLNKGWEKENLWWRKDMMLRIASQKKKSDEGTWYISDG